MLKTANNIEMTMKPMIKAMNKIMIGSIIRPTAFAVGPLHEKAKPQECGDAKPVPNTKRRILYAHERVERLSNGADFWPSPFFRSSADSSGCIFLWAEFLEWTTTLHDPLVEPDIFYWVWYLP